MSSSDYWRDDDSEFIALLNQVELPGDISQAERNPDAASHLPAEKQEVGQPNRKRPYSPSPRDETDVRKPSSKLALVNENSEASAYMQSHTYGASSFGNWGEYMRRKRAKLQIQNAEMDAEGNPLEPGSRIFEGLQIHVRGLLLCRIL